MSGSAPLSMASQRVQPARRKANGARQALAVVPARPGDHPAAQSFLNSMFCGSARVEFRTSLEDPSHEPRDRLLLKRGGAILGHALITHRAIRLGRAIVSAAGLQGLATTPGIRGQGFGALLLRRAERQMIDEGHAVGLLATEEPRFFSRFGWVPCGRRNQYKVNVCKVLSALASKGMYPKIRKPLDIRPLRRMELPGVARIYRMNVDRSYGPLERSDAYWQWLVTRGGFNEFLVAIDRADRRAARSEPLLVGYAVLKKDCLVELFTLPDHTKASIQLLARSCGEAIERGVDTLRIDLAPKHPLGRLLKSAGARKLNDGGRRTETLMAKVLCPERMLQRLGIELLARADEGGLSMPLELGFAVDGRKYQLAMDESTAGTAGNGRQPSQTVQATSGSIGRSYLRLDSSQLTRLLMGQVDWSAAQEIEASTKLAEQTATVLFPHRPLWRPLFDDLQAGGR